MTAEVDPCVEVSLVQEKLADASAYGDFPIGGARDCDAIAHLEDNEIDRDGDYGSYVMVNGSDAVSEDSVHVDLNAEGELECFGAGSIKIDPEFEVAEPRIKNENDATSCVSKESGGVSQIVEKTLGESASDCQMNEFEVRNNVSDGDQKQGEEKEMEFSEKVEEITKSRHSICETADYYTNHPQANSGEEKHENKNRLDSNGTVGEPEMEVDAFVPDQNGDVVHEADNGNKLNASPNANDEDTANGKNKLVLKENQLDENREDFVVGQSGGEEDDLERNLEAISTNEADTVLERENANTDDENAADENEQDFVEGQLKEEEADLEKNLLNVSTNEANIVLERENANASDEDAVDEKNILILEEKHLDENIEDFVVGQSREAEDDLENNLTSVSTTEANILLERKNANPNDEDAANDKSTLILEENHLDENGDVFVVGQSGEEEDPEKNLENVSTNEANIVLERENAKENDEDATNDKHNLILEENHMDEKGEDFVVGQPREEEDDLDKTLGTVSTNEANILSETETTDNSLCHGNEDCLAARQDQDEDPQTAEFVNCVSTSDGCEIASCKKNCTSLVVSDTNMEIMAGGPSEEHDVVLDKSLEKNTATDPCLTDDIDAQAEGSMSGEKGDELPTSPDEIMAGGPSEEHDVVLDKSLEKNTATDPCLTDDIDAQAEGSMSGEKGDGLPTSPGENKASNTSITDDTGLTGRNIPEGNRQLENTEGTPSVMVGSVALNCKEMFPSLPFNNTAIKSFLKAKTPTSQEFSSSGAENVKLVKEVKNVSESIDNPDSSCLSDASVEAKPANGTVEEDTQSSILGDDEGKLNSLSDGIEFESNGSTCQEVKVTDEIHRDVCIATLEHPSHDTAEVQNIVAEMGSGPFYFIRFPRYEDDITREKIKYAQSQVDQKTRIRESFQAQIQTAKATCKEFGSNLDAAKLDGKAARDLLKTKRKEIDSAQSVINKAKNAMSIDDIGIRINKLEHMIAHETLPLKEEKQLVREIKQWTQLRDQLSLDAGKQSELQLALDQKDQIEERLTHLWKEMDLVKDNVLKADALTMSVKKMYDGERGKFNELQSQFEAANKIRQEAFAHLQRLKQPYKEKLNYFGKYKNDTEEAKNLALSRDRVKLQRHAVKQVETFMERWNNDDEFRKDYMRCNTRSTLRRLGTLDGRSLGPDEEPPVLNNIVKGRAATDNSVSLGSTVEQDKQPVHVETVKDNLKTTNVEEKKDHKSKTKNPVAVVVTKPNNHKTVSSGVELVETRDSDEVEVVDSREEEDKRSKEEDELAKRAEELRKEEEAIRLKEQLKLEEKAKAKEALERKKRLAEKAQARAAIKAQKEAEEREKDKQKKAMRKERKNAVGGGEARNDAIEEESATPTATPTDTRKESEMADKPKTTTTKSQKRSQFTKQNKTTSIPAPLRKRGKRKMETWMWILLTAVIVLALFFLGNGGFLGKLGMGNFSFKI